MLRCLRVSVTILLIIIFFFLLLRYIIRYRKDMGYFSLGDIMQYGIGVGKLLFFSFVAVVLIPVISIIFNNAVLEKQDVDTEKTLLSRQYRTMQRILLREHVERTIVHFSDLAEESNSALNVSHRAKDDLRNRMLRSVRHVRFGESGRLFVLNSEGVLLSDPWMGEEEGKNVLALEDSTGEKMYAELLGAALADSGGYVEYYWAMPGKTGKRLTISYAKYYQERGWIVCAGMLSEDMDKTVAAWEKTHRENINHKWEMRGAAFLGALFISLFVSFLFSRLFRREFTVFSQSFEKAAVSRGNLDTSRLNLGEFIRLSDSINRVLHERDVAEKAEQAGEQLYRSIVKDIPGMLCRFLPDGCLTFVNDEYCRYFNRTREELLGSSFFALIPEEGRDEVRREFLSRTPEQPVVTYEHPVIAPGGVKRWQRWTDRAIFDEREVREYQVFGEDITESRNAMEAIQASEEKFSRMFRLSPSLKMLIDASTLTVMDVNDACISILGLRPEEMVGRNVEEISIWEDSEERERVWKEGVEKGLLENREVNFYNFRMEERKGLLSFEVFRMNERDVILVVVSDITSLEQTRAELRESERRIATLVDSLPGVAYRCGNDESWTFEYVSEGALEITGYPPSDLVGNRIISWNDLILPEDRKRVRQEIDICLAQHRHYVIEYRILDRAGEEKWIWEKGLGVYGPEGDVIALEGFIADITKQKLAREALLASEEKIRFMAENSADILWHMDAKYCFTYISASDKLLYGYLSEEIIGMSLFQFLTPDGIDQVRKENERRLAMEREGIRTEVIRYELQLKCKDGSLVWTEVSVNPYRDIENRLTGYYGMIHDITERKAAEKALRASEEKYRELVENAQEIIVVIQSAEIVFANVKATEVLGYSKEEFTYRSFLEFIDSGDRERMAERYKVVLSGASRPERQTLRVYRKSGELAVMEVSSVRIIWENTPALLVFLTDITKRKAAEEALRASEEKFSRVFLSSPNLMVLLDGAAHTIVDVNDAFTSMTGYLSSEVKGHLPDEFNAWQKEEERSLVYNFLSQKDRVSGMEIGYRCKSGEIRRGLLSVEKIDLPGNPLVLVVVNDITSLKEAETALRESEERFRSLVEEENGFPVQGYDRNRRVIFWNTASEKLYGYPREEAMGGLLEELIIPSEMREQVIRGVEDWVNKGIPTPPGELDLLHKDGSSVPVYSRHVLIRNRHGDPEMYCIDMNLAERRQAEAALRESEERYRSLVETTSDWVWEVDDRGNYTYSSPKVRELLGYEPEEMVGKSPFDFMSAEEADRAIRTVGSVMRNHLPVSGLENTNLRRNGSTVVLETNAVPVFDSDGVFRGYRGIDRDITERKRAEIALIESEEKHRILLDESSDPIFSFVPGGYYTYVNRAFAEGVGKPVEKIIGNRIWDVFDEEEARKRFAVLEMVFKTGREKVFEVRVPRPESDRFYLTTVTPIKDRQGDVISVICSSKEITDRVRADEALLAEKERLAVTLRSIGDGVITTDRQGRVLLLNRVAEELTGWTQNDAEGHALEEVFHIVNELTRDRCENPVERVLTTGSIVGLSNYTLLINRNGREIVVADSGAPIFNSQSVIIGVVLVFRDVTAQKRMETELLRMEKLKSVGVLAGGIAHDFNNILTGILGAISMVRLNTPAADASHNMLREAEHQAMRARDLTGQLLTFSKGGAPVRITASIVETVRETVNFALHGSRVRAVFTLPDDLWTALVDLNQLSHVVNNLTLNSLQAMPEGGNIEVEAGNTVISKDSGLPLAPGRYILLSFRDYGVGISREHLSRIFDPYFTTKQMGSGLGLATTWSIIKRHEGHIRVESKLGIGTKFYIYLPATGVIADTSPMEIEQLIHGHGRVLVMDDDEGIRTTASMLLEALGYDVETVKDGASAIDLFRRAREEGSPFDAIIMDLTVPGGMGGLEAMMKIRALDPTVRAIVSSGYSTDPIMAEYADHGFAGVLVKPYCAEDLGKALRKVIVEK